MPKITENFLLVWVNLIQNNIHWNKLFIHGYMQIKQILPEKYQNSFMVLQQIIKSMKLNLISKSDKNMDVTQYYETMGEMENIQLD